MARKFRNPQAVEGREAGKEIVRRFGFLLVATVTTMGAGCPVQQGEREPEVEDWRQEIYLRSGETEQVDGGQLAITLHAVEGGRRLAFVTLRLEKSSGESIEEQVKQARNVELSQALRLEPYAVRIVGFPGVDSAQLLVIRETSETTPP